MSLISIAQKETFHISFVQFANQDYKADLLTPESYKVKKNCRYCDSSFYTTLNNYSLLLRMISSASFASAFVSCGVSFKI